MYIMMDNNNRDISQYITIHYFQQENMPYNTRIPRPWNPLDQPQHTTNIPDSQITPQWRICRAHHRTWRRQSRACHPTLRSRHCQLAIAHLLAPLRHIHLMGHWNAILVAGKIVVSSCV